MKAEFKYSICLTHTHPSALIIVSPAWWDTLKIDGYLGDMQQNLVYSTYSNPNELEKNIDSVKSKILESAMILDKEKAERIKELNRKLLYDSKITLIDLGFNISDE